LTKYIFISIEKAILTSLNQATDMLSSGVFPTFPKHESKNHVVLLIIDPQVDFHEGGSLAVAGATADAKRIAFMITQHANNIGQVFVTLDSHHRNHIAHARLTI
jgi:cephalosporin hydroxylase